MKIFKLIHKWLGMLMAPLMVMWFISGYVMIFSGFPRVSNESKFALLDVLSARDTVPNIEELTSWYKIHTNEGAKLTGISLEKGPKGLSLNLFGSEGSISIDPNKGDLNVPSKPSLSEIEQMTIRVAEAKPLRIDTLSNIEQWVPFASHRKELPIYRVSVDDKKGTVLYFSGKSGKLLQQTNSHSRILAYFGAIPHWLYLWQIREHIDLWKDIIIILSMIGCVMIISGIVIGIQRTMLARKMRHKKWSPYRRRWYKWHHISGLIFGFFVLTWMFSGWMSLDKLPKWMTGEPPRKEFYTVSIGGEIDSRGTIDIDVIAREYPYAKRITYANYLGTPFYHVEDGERSEYITLNGGYISHLEISEDQAVKYISSVVPDTEVETVSTIMDYTSDYLPHPKGRRKPPLPAIKINTKEGTTLYISTASPRIQVSNRATIMNSWAYQKLHAFKFLWAYKHPSLWMALMLTLLTGGTIVSITGIVLGWKVLSRRFRKG